MMIRQIRTPRLCRLQRIENNSYTKKGIPNLNDCLGMNRNSIFDFMIQTYPLLEAASINLFVSQ